MIDNNYMKIALALAAKADGKTFPNPMVGAVIVTRGQIVGTGYHKKAGTDHAEIIAIKQAGSKCTGSTMYVTLEPCDHYGKTPPCTKAIIESGIRKVVVAMRDPNPVTSGKGIRKLRNNGIEVVCSLCAKEAARLNRKYIKFITSGMPYVTLKIAQSLDGKIAARDGSSKWISNKSSRSYVKNIRAKYGAILIGTNTLLKDDPFLLDEARKGYNVHRVIVDSALKMSVSSNIIKTAAKAPVIIAVTEDASKRKSLKFRNINGVEIICLKSKTNRVPLRRLFKELAKRGIVDILVEGGGEIAGSILQEGLLDEVMFFIAPKLLGGKYDSVKGKGVSNINKALDLSELEFKHFGEDIMVQALVVKAS